jgi:hypothetical protein
LTLAQTAIQQVPDSPEFNDTLGMVYLKKAWAPWLCRPLELAVRKDPANPEFQYTLVRRTSRSAGRRMRRQRFRRLLLARPGSRALTTPVSS